MLKTAGVVLQGVDELKYFFLVLFIRIKITHYQIILSLWMIVTLQQNQVNYFSICFHNVNADPFIILSLKYAFCISYQIINTYFVRWTLKIFRTYNLSLKILL